MGVRIAGSCLHLNTPSSVRTDKLSGRETLYSVLQDTVTCEAASFKGYRHDRTAGAQ